MQTSQPSLTAIGERLRWAIERRPANGRQRGLKLFQRDMQELSRARQLAGREPIEGVSLPSIVSYLPTESRPVVTVWPGVAFLEAAAEVCGVRAAWLTYGEGFPTEAHESAAKVSDTLAGADEAKSADALRLATSLLRALGTEARQGVLGAATSHYDLTDLWASPDKVTLPHWLTTVAEIRLRLIMSGAYNEVDPIGGTGPLSARRLHEHVERDIGHALHATLRAFRLTGAQLSARELDDYVSLMLPALLHLTNCIARVGHNAVESAALAIDASEAPAPASPPRARKAARTK